MLVKLTEFGDNKGGEFYLDVRNIRLVKANTPQVLPSRPGKREDLTVAVAPTAPTTVVTYTFIQGGFQAFDVAEKVEDVIAMVNNAWAMKSPSLN